MLCGKLVVIKNNDEALPHAKNESLTRIIRNSENVSYYLLREQEYNFKMILFFY